MQKRYPTMAETLKKRVRKIQRQTNKILSCGRIREQNTQTPLPRYNNECRTRLCISIRKNVVNGLSQSASTTIYGWRLLHPEVHIKAKINSYFRDTERVQSKNLGSNYITYSTKRHHQHIENSYVILNDYKIPLPRYYKNKFLSSEQIAQLTKRMQLLSDAKKEKLLKTIQNKYPHNTEQINQRNLELSKLNTKFDKRNETI